jgi:3-methyladenine DNA glycosylase/8-oxoguanine DNA glycosylase
MDAMTGDGRLDAGSAAAQAPSAPDGRQMDGAPVETEVRLPFRVHVALTLAPLRHGPGDPTIRFAAGEIWRATRTPAGPATIRIRPRGGGGFGVMAWGRGAEAAIDGLPRLLGDGDDPAALELPAGPLRDLARRFADVRFTRSGSVMESLVPAVIEQKVVGIVAQRSYRALVLRYGERAPGPAGLWLTPRPEVLAAIPYHALHPLGLEQRRASILARVARHAAWLETAPALPPTEALARLQAIHGIGPWTAAETMRTACGDPDAVSVGDYHTPSLVAWVMAGEPRADDARMLELLEPYRGQRARLVRLLELSGWRPPKRGPRMPLRSIAGM